MDVLASYSIFQELQLVHDTGYFSALPSLEENWQQVNPLFFPLHSALSTPSLFFSPSADPGSNPRRHLCFAVSSAGISPFRERCIGSNAIFLKAACRKNPAMAVDDLGASQVPVEVLLLSFSACSCV